VLQGPEGAAPAEDMVARSRRRRRPNIRGVGYSLAVGHGILAGQLGGVAVRGGRHLPHALYSRAHSLAQIEPRSPVPSTASAAPTASSRQSNGSRSAFRGAGWNFCRASEGIAASFSCIEAIGPGYLFVVAWTAHRALRRDSTRQILAVRARLHLVGDEVVPALAARRGIPRP
jgi:hypothetical protein